MRPGTDPKQDKNQPKLRFKSTGMLIKVCLGIYLSYITYIHFGTLVLGLNVPLETYLELSRGPQNIPIFSLNCNVHLLGCFNGGFRGTSGLETQFL